MRLSSIKKRAAPDGVVDFAELSVVGEDDFDTPNSGAWSPPVQQGLARQFNLLEPTGLRSTLSTQEEPQLRVAGRGGGSRGKAAAGSPDRARVAPAQEEAPEEQ